jgi:hypothetical protein
MMTEKKQPEEIIEMLDLLRDVPKRDASRRAAGKAQFLAQVKRISEKTVSISWFARLMNVSRSSIPNYRLSTLTIGLILAMLLLTFSTTSFARQAQPDQFLYPLKLWLEDQRVGITSQTADIIELRLDYAEERLREMEQTNLNLSNPALQNSISNFMYNLAEAARLIAEDPAHEPLLERLNSLQSRFDELISRLQEDQEDKAKTSDDKSNQFDDENIDDDREEENEPDEDLDDDNEGLNDRRDDDEVESDDTDDEEDITDDKDSAFEDPDDSDDSNDPDDGND